jgi:hypothetical protein
MDARENKKEHDTGEKEMNNFSLLPDETIVEILSYFCHFHYDNESSNLISFKSLASLAMVDRRFNRLIEQYRITKAAEEQNQEEITQENIGTFQSIRESLGLAPSIERKNKIQHELDESLFYNEDKRNRTIVKGLLWGTAITSLIGAAGVGLFNVSKGVAINWMVVTFGGAIGGAVGLGGGLIVIITCHGIFHKCCPVDLMREEKIEEINKIDLEMNSKRSQFLLGK